VEGTSRAGGARPEGVGIEEIRGEGSGAGGGDGQGVASQEAGRERPVLGGSVRRGKVRGVGPSGLPSVHPPAPTPQASAPPASLLLASVAQASIPEPAPSSSREESLLSLHSALGEEGKGGPEEDGQAGGLGRGGGAGAAEACSSDEEGVDGGLSGRW